MKKVLKSRKNATKYADWEIALGTSTHPKYNASFQFYKDVLSELIICQKGLCAYTEYRLLSISEVKELKKSFPEGKFVGELKDLPIDIEHFDSRLKTSYAWKWSNLFAVFSTINQKVKRREEAKLIANGKSVHDILKPDLPGYDPTKLLTFVKSLNMFVPNNSRSTVEKNQIQEMINCLGLNNDFIKEKRREYFCELDFRLEFGETVKPHQFITGWQMR